MPESFRSKNLAKVTMKNLSELSTIITIIFIMIIFINSQHQRTKKKGRRTEMGNKVKMENRSKDGKEKRRKNNGEEQQNGKKGESEREEV